MTGRRVFPHRSAHFCDASLLGSAGGRYLLYFVERVRKVCGNRAGGGGASMEDISIISQHLTCLPGRGLGWDREYANGTVLLGIVSFR